MTEWIEVSKGTGARIDANGFRAWIDGRQVSRDEWMSYMHWRSPDFIFQELMEFRCFNCYMLHEDCKCCSGCGQPDADIIGDHGYGCVM